MPAASSGARQPCGGDTAGPGWGTELAVLLGARERVQAPPIQTWNLLQCVYISHCGYIFYLKVFLKNIKCKPGLRVILQHAGLSPPPGPFPELPHSVDPCGMLAGTPAFRLTGVPAPCFIRTTQNKPGPKTLSARSAQLRAATFTWEGCRQPLSCQNHEAHRTHRIYRLHLFFCDKSVP